MCIFSFRWSFWSREYSVRNFHDCHHPRFMFLPSFIPWVWLIFRWILQKIWPPFLPVVIEIGHFWLKRPTIYRFSLGRGAGMWWVSSWLEFTRVSNSNFDSNSTLFRVYRELVTRTHSYPADFQKTRWLTQLDDFDSSSTRVCQKLRSRRVLLSLLIYFTTEINRFELSITDFPGCWTNVHLLKQKLKKIDPNFFKTIKKPESNSSFDSNFTRTRRIFSKFYELETRTHSKHTQFQKTRDSNSLATYYISKDSWLSIWLDKRVKNSLTTFQLVT